ncbi:MAG: hypothetical protein CM1200mP39_25640 [Dehalococcoidia bacterium]|nr:MAG: hypothetical protein CM1200mP39_25640 [Dehalococcoidia bacterium]
MLPMLAAATIWRRLNRSLWPNRLLVNNAALYGDISGGRFDQIPDSQWDNVMNVNIKGIWNCCRACVPSIRESGGGTIINISSLAATYGMPYALDYAMSKAAVSV